MWIAICDDVKDECDIVERLITEYAVKYDYDIHCRAFTSGEALLQSDQIFDMYILDFQMDDMDGMELAKTLRKEKHVKSYIVFLTAYMHFVQEAFKVNTHRFLHKPVKAEELYEALNSLMLPSVYAKHIQLTRASRMGTAQTEMIYTEDIICVEAQGKTSRVTTVKETASYSCLMKEIYDKLPEQLFCKVHRSYIVNFEHVKSYCSRERYITMDNGMIIPISRELKNDFVRNNERFVERFK